MSRHKCDQSFYSTKNKRYHYGNIISQYEFNSLNFMEQRNFFPFVEKPKEDEDDLKPTFSNSSFDNSLYPDGRDFGNSIDNDTFTNNSDDGNLDFGGGDSEGGGSTGEW